MFRLEMRTDNDAFCDTPESEIARILRVTAEKLEGGHPAGNLFDLNGNRIGSFAFSDT